jgi:RNA polymerase sigma factor (sigma-70 family)
MLRAVVPAKEDEDQAQDASDSVSLFEAGRAGRSDAIGDLIVRHLPDIRAFVRMQCNGELRALEQETDLVQSVCREILERPDRVEFRGDREFRSWLYCAVLHKVRDKLRHHHRQRRDVRRRVHDDGAAALLSGYESLLTPSRVAEAAEELRRFEAACEQLNERQREVLAMTRIAGMTHAEVAERLGCTEVASRQLLNRALAKLAVFLERGS